MANLSYCCYAFLLLLLLLAPQQSEASAAAARNNRHNWASATTTAARKFWFHEKHRAPSHIHGLLRSIPALSKQRREIKNHKNHDGTTSSNLAYREDDDLLRATEEVAVKTAKPKKKSVLPSFPSFPSLPSITIPKPSVEFFHDITPQTYLSSKSNTESPSASKQAANKKVDLREGMTEALQELKTLRQEMEAMRKELGQLRQFQMGGEGGGITVEEQETDMMSPEILARQQRQRQREFEKLGAAVEHWAEKILFPKATDDATDDGWTEVPCNKMLRSKYNPDGRTRAFLKWMKDSRGPSDITQQQQQQAASSSSKNNRDQEWPCMRLYSTIEAPIDQVCLYLSQEKHLFDYNSLLEKHQELEEVTSHSKICWGQTPQILFIKPRDLITFCSFRWRRDGTQVVVNQACDGYKNEHSATAYALRGATFIGPDPDCPDERTRIAMLAHASPGADVPVWMCKTAIKSLAPIEPYRLFYKINKGVQRFCRTSSTDAEENSSSGQKMKIAEMVANSDGDDRVRLLNQCPAGLAQLGYACFWPHGSSSSSSSAPRSGLQMPANNDNNNNNKENDEFNNDSEPLLEQPAVPVGGSLDEGESIVEDSGDEEQ